MIRKLESIKDNTLVFDLEGFITAEEIQLIDKEISAKLTEIEPINMMVFINVKGETVASFIKEFQLGIKYWNKINKIAYVADHKNLKIVVAIDNLFTKFKEKYFELNELEKAWDWISENH
ncbi:STAS/SEC14 domain-containing protein [Ulvibacter litoralis]|uniref:SpoIIAA-like n=1 Tax=Ulvibacter litoralis TaxID=227084 RepID=A0A1G7EVT6_9FLAO|nr:STAS/SEC14 domain-containing protein [Ulvibacter litoralis]GHC53707.1 hypothetical protein GCM10008083_17250 [Ulvibacter litoralis]SDE67814.1 SpoIIAA-like [Ulvibacter litoralis]